MFDGRRNQVFALASQESGSSKDRHVIALGSGAGGDDFARFAAENTGGSFTSFVEEDPGSATDVMNAGRVAEDLPKQTQHGLAHRWIQRRGSVVIEIDGAHSRSL